MYYKRYPSAIATRMQKASVFVISIHFYPSLIFVWGASNIGREGGYSP